MVNRRIGAAALLAIISLNIFPLASQARSHWRWHHPLSYAQSGTAGSAFQPVSYSGTTSSQLTVIQVLNALNNLRLANGLPPVRLEKRLNVAAQQHSDYMAASRLMSHTGSGGSSPMQRISATGYDWRKVAENVAAGQRTAAEVVNAWAHSPGHRANMLSADVTEVGIGMTNHYWTMDLARP